VRRVFVRTMRSETEPERRSGGRLASAARFTAELALSAGCLGVAALGGAPGAVLHARIAALAAWLVVRRRAEVALEDSYPLVLSPMDSVRYFEFAFAWERLSLPRGGRYLDVSSPRQFPLLVARRFRQARVELVNPDPSDLAVTRTFVQALGLRCELHARTAAQCGGAQEPYDLVTTISVLEHIASPDDAEAVRVLWDVLKPGGKLIVTVPCARDGFEEYLEHDEYGLGTPSTDGYHFFQRFYDEASLEAVFFRTAGHPTRSAVFGERRAGLLAVDRACKMQGRHERWREPYLVVRDLCPFRSVRDLPGWGVVGMEFTKS
jgi:SAM-dependent methyltransferase